jgi:drug/metabolite transporter (DMT)-like permease
LLRVRRVSAADLMLLATALVWGVNVTTAKYALSHGLRPLTYSSVRYTAAAVIFAAIVGRRERTLRCRRRELPLVALAGIAGVLLNQLCFAYGLRATTAATAALILGVMPVVTGVVAWAVRFERPTRRFWICAAVAFCGAALVASDTPGGVSSSTRGDVLMFSTALTWGIYSVAVAPLMRRYSPYRVSALVLVVGDVPLLAAAAPQLAAQRWDLGVLVWLALTFATLASLVLTNVLWFEAIARVGPSRATIFTTLQPFVGAVSALLLLSEPLGWLQVLGGITIGGAIALLRVRVPVRLTRPRSLT